jgi:membrane carboxypeptidase/penicillin-binding protein
MRPVPHYLDKILDNQGRVIYDQKEVDKKANKVPERALTEDEADIMTKMLESVVDDGTGSNIREIFDIRGDIAGKTGTTQDHADAWFMCYTPDLVCGAWAGAEIPKVHFRTIDYGQGSKAALPMCGSFLSRVFADPKFRRLATTQFPEPKPEITSLVECDNYVRDSTYIDSVGVRHAVQGSGVRRMYEEERLLEAAGLESTNQTPVTDGNAPKTPVVPAGKDPKDKPKKKEPDDKEIDKLMKEGNEEEKKEKEKDKENKRE